MILQNTLLLVVWASSPTPTADDAWTTWLRDDGAERAVLVEAQSHDGTQVVTHYLSNKSFVSDADSSVGALEYIDIITGGVEFHSSIDGSFGAGNIDVLNLNGEFDDWLTHAWKGWPLKIYLGDPNWARDDFRLILNACSDGITSPQRDRISIAVRDRRNLLAVPLLSVRADGQLNPLALGEGFNAKPILIDANTQRYKLHSASGLLRIKEVRDRGAPVEFRQTEIDLAAGEFTLVAAPVDGFLNGEITCDYEQESKTAVQMISYIASLAGYDLLDESLNQFPNGAILQRYVSEQINAIDLMVEIAHTVGAEPLLDRLGYIRLVRIEEPAGEPSIEIGADDIAVGQISVVALDQPREFVTLSWGKNWTPQQDANLAGITEDLGTKQLYMLANKGVVTSSNNLLARFPLAEQPEVVETLFTTKADAQAEANRRAALRNKVRPTVRTDGYAVPLGSNVGDTASITHPRFGLAAGALTKIVKVIDRPAIGRAQLELWR